MLLAANELGMAHLPIGEAGLYALLGYAVVFLGLILLMIVVMVIGKIFIAKAAKEAKAIKSNTNNINNDIPLTE